MQELSFTQVISLKFKYTTPDPRGAQSVYHPEFQLSPGCPSSPGLLPYSGFYLRGPKLCELCERL